MAGRNRLRISRQTLVRLYHKQGATQAQVAKILGCSCLTVARRMQEFGIKSRPRGPKRRTHRPQEERQVKLTTVKVRRGQTHRFRMFTSQHHAA